MARSTRAHNAVAITHTRFRNYRLPCPSLTQPHMPFCSEHRLEMRREMGRWQIVEEREHEDTTRAVQHEGPAVPCWLRANKSRSRVVIGHLGIQKGGVLVTSSSDAPRAVAEDCHVQHHSRTQEGVLGCSGASLSLGREIDLDLALGSEHHATEARGRRECDCALLLLGRGRRDVEDVLVLRGALRFTRPRQSSSGRCSRHPRARAAQTKSEAIKQARSPRDACDSRG